MKRYQKFILCGVVIAVLIVIFTISGRVTSKAVYLWDSSVTEQLAEVDRNSLVLQISEKDNLDYVFYIKGCKFGYIKKEYLTDIFHRGELNSIEIE